MRDGYTSKRHFDLIEDGLIQILTSVFPEKVMLQLKIDVSHMTASCTHFSRVLASTPDTDMMTFPLDLGVAHRL